MVVLLDQVPQLIMVLACANEHTSKAATRQTLNKGTCCNTMVAAPWKWENMYEIASSGSSYANYRVQFVSATWFALNVRIS